MRNDGNNLRFINDNMQLHFDYTVPLLALIFQLRVQIPLIFFLVMVMLCIIFPH